MITINNFDQVIIKYNDKEYNIKDKSDYKNLIILLTDPSNQIDPSVFDLDEEVTDERQKLICVKYQEFFNSYLLLKESAIEEAKEALKKVIEAE